MNATHHNICNISFHVFSSLFLGLKQQPWKCNRFSKGRREQKGNEKMTHIWKKKRGLGMKELYFAKFLSLWCVRLPLFLPLVYKLFANVQLMVLMLSYNFLQYWKLQEQCLLNERLDPYSSPSLPCCTPCSCSCFLK
jgi:hypothetical protein